MKKILTSLLFLSSCAVMAQHTLPIGENSKGKLTLTSNSFTQVIDKSDNTEYIGLSINFIPVGQELIAGKFIFKLASKDCWKPTNLLEVDGDGKTRKEIKVNFKGDIGDGNLANTTAALICDYARMVKENPELMNETIQGQKTYVLGLPERAWTVMPKLEVGNFSVAQPSLKFENVYTSMAFRLQNAGDKSGFYKFYIDTEYCREGKGLIEMKTIDAIELIDRPFDLSNKSNDPEEKSFLKAAKIICDYTMKNKVFRDRIVLPTEQPDFDYEHSALKEWADKASKSKDKK